MKRNLDDRMSLTKLPVTTAVISETCAKPTNTNSYMLLLSFFKPKQIDNILWVILEMKTFPYHYHVFWWKCFFFLKKSGNFAEFLLTITRFPRCFFFHQNFYTKWCFFKIFSPLKSTIGTSGKSLGCCALTVNSKLTFGKIFSIFE